MQSAFYFALLAVGFGLGTSIVLNLLLKIFHLRKITFVMLLLVTLLILLISLTHSKLIVWLAILPLGITIAAAYAALITLFSDQVDINSQGWVMGITGSIMAACFALAALFVGLLNDFGNRVPIIFSGAVMGFSTYLMYYYTNKLVD
ncbi:MAG: hypothetical protein AB7F64_00370 [Gammaproteobacteria bacterium]